METGVSIVIPAFRAEELLARAVRSALAQTCLPLEIVIVADDRTDYRPILARAGVADHRLRFANTGGEGTGPGNARNVGLDLARGQVIASLDADDMLEPRALELLVPRAIEHGAAYGRVRYMDQVTGDELESFDRPLPAGPKELEEILTSQVHTWAGIVFDRKRVSARWPPWREPWEDVCFYVRCFDDLDTIWHVAETVYRYFRVPGSICNRPGVGEEFERSTLRWLARLAGDGAGVRNEASRETFRRYLESRRALEAAFVRSVDEGEEDDFHRFVGRMQRFFHQLEIPEAGHFPLDASAAAER